MVTATHRPPVLAVGLNPPDFAALVAELSGATDVSRAATLAAAEDALASRPARAVICDADTIDWRQALAVLRPLCENVIFLARTADERFWLDILEAGACDLVAKPYRADDLRWVVQAAVQSGKAVKAQAV